MSASTLFQLSRLFPNIRALLKTPSWGATHSFKDLAARATIDAAENLGVLHEQTRIVEATNGTSAVALASVAAARGLDLTIVAPEDLDDNKRRVLESLGAKMLLTPAKLGLPGAKRVVDEAKRDDPNVWVPDLFNASAVPFAYETFVAPELFREADRQIDVFIAGVGSGNLFTGIARYLRRKTPTIERVAVEPKESPFLSEGNSGVHGIVGLGQGTVSSLFDRNLPTRIETVSTEEANEWRRLVARTEGLLIGNSTGANLAVVARLAVLPEYQGKTIVTVAFSQD